MIRSVIGLGILGIRKCVDVLLSVAIKITEAWAEVFKGDKYSPLDLNVVGFMLFVFTIVASFVGVIVCLAEGWWLELIFWTILPTWPMGWLRLVHWYENPPHPTDGSTPKFRWPWTPQVVVMPNGKFAVRRRSFSGYEYFDRRTSNYYWWLVSSNGMYEVDTLESAMELLTVATHIPSGEPVN